MRASPSGVFQGHRRSISGRSKSTASVTRHLQQPTKSSAQLLSTKRFRVPDVQNGTVSRNTRTSAGLVLPDPATGTCLIHNMCHIASAIVIVVATVRNVPQIVKCWRSKSAFGLSAAALATEVSCYACTVAYGVRKGYAATLWGSELACWGQDMTLLGLVAVLRGVRLPVMGAIGLGMLALKSFLFTEIVPLWFLSKMQIFVGLILGLGARVPQIILNHRNRHTGNLALPTYLFNTTANLVCCTSTAIITGDIYVMVKEIWMLSLNATIVAQILKTLKKDKEANANAAKTLPLPSTEIEERFRSHSVRLAGNWPRGSLSEDGDVPDAALKRRRSKRRGEVITGPGSWTLDTTSGSRRAGIKSHSLDSDNLSSLDDYESSQVDKKGSMDGMRPSLA